MAPPAAQAPDFLQLHQLVKSFDGLRAVDAVSLDIAKGEIFALLGSSGCGKSTLLRLLAGFETPDSGRIVLDGADLAGLPPHRRPLNMMFQSYALFPHLSVRDNIAFGLRREGMARQQVDARVDAMLKLVQLTRFGARRPHQLSGGQQQRVALARSLARQPQLLLLDEPLGALDKKLREQTQIELVNIIGEVGVTCVMVTHDQEEAMTMASRIAVMSEGRLLQVGAPGEIYENPASRFVADFIGDVNLIAGRVESADPNELVVVAADCRIRVAAVEAARVGAEVTVAVRPEKIVLSRAALEGGVNQTRGRIREMGYFGSHTVYHLDLPSGAVMKATLPNAQRERSDRFARGDEVWAQWAAPAAVVLMQ